MNKQQIFGNMDSKNGTNLLMDRIIDKKILFINTAKATSDLNTLNGFFDIIITKNRNVLEQTHADIFIDERDTPYENNILTLDVFKNNPDTIFCLKQSFVSILVKSKQTLDNFIIVCDEFNPNKTLDLSKNKLFINIEESQMKFEELSSYLNNKNKYNVFVNLTFKNRKNFIYSW